MIKVVYFATPEISVKSLEKLYKSENIELMAVITQPDRPKGRGNKLTPPPVKVFAENNGIICYQTEKISKDITLIEKLKQMEPDFFVTFAFGQILSQEVLDIPKYSTVNLHASLLPKYRGANPIQRCIYNGDKKTGITTMLTVLELDAGDICETLEIDIDENMTCVDLKDIISEKSPDLICSTLNGLFCGNLKPVKQCCDGITIAKKFVKQDGLIDWSKSAECLHNQVRSMVDFPTAYTSFGEKIIKITQTKLSNEKNNSNNPGEIKYILKEGIVINTGNGCLIVTKVKPENKGIMNAYDFANGAKLKTGMKFGE